MLRTEFFEHAKAWSLSCLENIFYYALEVKSKSLIQACIFVADQEFLGIASFSQHTQVKFLLESIRHIVSENCQEEFIHIMRYLKLLHSLCPDIGYVEEYVNCVSKINQTFILYTILENESVSVVCQILNDFFPEDNVLQSYGIEKGSTRKRFMAVIKRQIYNFRKLVVRLLADMDFRSYYFYDEWPEEYGVSYYEELKSDLNVYLRQVEACLLAGKDTNQVYESWLESDQCSNPALLYFLKLLVDVGTEVQESQIFELLSWTFSNTDFTPLIPENDHTLKIPPVFADASFVKVSSRAGWVAKEPWNFTSLHTLLATLVEEEQARSVELGKTVCGTKLHLMQAEKENLQNINVKTQTSAVKTPSKRHRTPFKEIDQNTTAISHSQTNKRKHDETEKSTSMAPKRPCLRSDGLKSPPPFALPKKSLLVDLCKNNFLMQVAGTSGKLDLPPNVDSAISVSINSPQCRQLLRSGYKFFSSSNRKMRSSTSEARDSSRQNFPEISSDDVIVFSDDENSQSDSEKLKIDDEAMGLTWIPLSTKLGSTPKKEGVKRTCRSLIFKSESSEDYISESDAELHAPWQMKERCRMIETADHVLLPDLSVHYEGPPTTKPCYVHLSLLSSGAQQCRGHMKIDGFRISRKCDIAIIRNEASTVAADS